LRNHPVPHTDLLSFPTRRSSDLGICNDADNCPLLPNPLQLDQDDDGIGDGCDNCIAAYNPCQEDLDNNGVGNACEPANVPGPGRSEEHTSELQSRFDLVCRLLLE